MTNMIATGEVTFTGPRWWDLANLVTNCAFAHDVEVEIEIEKRWLRQSVQCKFEGDAEDVREFMGAIDDIKDELNK